MVADPVPVLVQSDVAAFDTWLSAVQGGGPVTLIQHNTAVVQFAATLDLFCDPFGVLQPQAPAAESGGTIHYEARFPSVTYQGESRVKVGGNATMANLRSIRSRTGDARFEEQKRYVGAFAWQIRQLARGQVLTGERTGAALMLAIPAGYYVIAGICALAAIAATAVGISIHENAETERNSTTMAAVGEHYAGRLKVYRETGSMPPPSAVETAAGAMLQQSSDSFWHSLGTGLGEGVKTGSKWLLGGAAVALILAASSKSKAGE